MKNKFLAILAVFSFTAIIFSGCFKEEDDDDGNNNSNPGYIFYRWAKGDGCSSYTISGFSDNNSGVPNNASSGRFYGPCDEGSYDGTFNAGSISNYPLDYTLESPPDGYNRYYTQELVQFHVLLNRCVLSSAAYPEAVSYYDEPCNGPCDDGSGGGGGGGCTDPYESPTPNDAQLDALCQSAYVYRCGGYDSQADLSCAQYNSLASTGSGVPGCPYCN